MATREESLIVTLQTRLDALDAAAVTLGAADAKTLLGLLATTGMPYGRMDFSNAAQSNLVSALTSHVQPF